MYVDASKDADGIWRIRSPGSDNGCGRASRNDRLLLPYHKDGRTGGRVKPESQGNETLEELLFSLLSNNLFCILGIEPELMTCDVVLSMGCRGQIDHFI
jgi:hypothetical protein